MNDDRRARWSLPTFLVAAGGVLLVLGWISVRFLLPLALAVSAAVVLARVNERVVRLLRGRRGLAALLMTVATFIGVFAPLIIVLILLLNAALPLIDRGVELFTSGQMWDGLRGLMPEQVERLVNPEEVRAQLGRSLAGLGAGVAATLAAVPAFMANLLIDGFVAFLALFVYFARGPQITEAIVEATPMERRHTRALLDTLGTAIRTVYAASFITALIQFALGYVGFRIVGTPFALGLAAMMAFFSFIFSLVPVLGSGLVWGPVGITLLVTGRPIAGAFILAWGIVVLGSVDNIVKPLYAKGQMQLSPLLVFITLFGGVAVFGPVGALLGPLVAALAAGFLRIWTTEFLPDSKTLPRGGAGLKNKQKRRRGLLKLKRRKQAPPEPPHAAH